MSMFLLKLLISLLFLKPIFFFGLGPSSYILLYILLFIALTMNVVGAYFLLKKSKEKKHLEHLYQELIQDDQQGQDNQQGQENENYSDQFDANPQASDQHFKTIKPYQISESIASSIAPSDEVNDSEWLQFVQDTFASHMGNSQFSVELLANEMGLSKRHFQRKIKEKTGLSPNVYLKERRLEKAHKAWKDKATTAKELATLVGYSDEKYFAKLFKEKFDITL